MGNTATLKVAASRLWRNWPPGACIAVLACAAALFPIVTPTELTAQDKAKWIASLGFLVVLELVVIFKERRAQDRAYLKQLEGIEQMRTVTDARLTSLLRIAAAANDPIEGLKKRALQLSDSILEFVQNRLQSAPQETDLFQSYTSRMLNEPGYIYVNTFGQSLKYELDSVSFYKTRFIPTVQAILKEFADRGIVDEWLNVYYAMPAGHSIIRVIGERLGALTEMLKPAQE